MATARYLIYTVAFDAPGTGGARQMAKLMASSAIRSCVDADIVIFKNTDAPIFFIERKGLDEVYVETPPLDGDELAKFAMGWKAKAGGYFDAAAYDYVLFLDADCLLLRDFEHLLAGEAQIYYQPERGRRHADEVFNGFLTDSEMTEGTFGTNSGTFAVKGNMFNGAMKLWRDIQKHAPIRETRWVEQSAWHRLILDKKKASPHVQPFEAGEVRMPLHLERDQLLNADATVLHYVGADTQTKLKHMFGDFMRQFFFDPRLTLLNLLET